MKQERLQEYDQKSSENRQHLYFILQSTQHVLLLLVALEVIGLFVKK